MAADESACTTNFPDNREEVVQDGMTLIEAQILCAMRIADLPRRAAAAGAGRTAGRGAAAKTSAAVVA